MDIKKLRRIMKVPKRKGKSPEKIAKILRDKVEILKEEMTDYINKEIARMNRECQNNYL